jgi:hypothetical protein
MTILLSLIITFTTVNNPEPEFGDWVCDAIREVKNVDFVLLPNSIFAENTSYRTRSAPRLFGQKQAYYIVHFFHTLASANFCVCSNIFFRV